MTATTDFARRYDRFMFDPAMQDIYGESGFFNVGYWSADTRDQQAACEALLERMTGNELAMRQRILDVACGSGATTRWLKAHAPGRPVVGINISERQVRISASQAPGCQFLVTDAARTGLADDAFDCLVCVEAAFHFDTRRAFLTEAFRVLRPGGSLLVSDILFADASYIGAWLVPGDNAVDTIGAYAALLEGAGFEDVALSDVTDQCWHAFCRRRLADTAAQFARGEIDAATWGAQRKYLTGLLNDCVRHYVIASARKPSAAGRAIAASHAAASCDAEAGRSSGSEATARSRTSDSPPSRES